MTIQFDIQNLFIAKNWRPGLKRVELEILSPALQSSILRKSRRRDTHLHPMINF
jgi:hypothetical protein